MAQVFRSFDDHLQSIVNPQPQEQPGTAYGIGAAAEPSGVGGTPISTTASLLSPQAPAQRVHTAPGGQGPYVADPQVKGVFERLFAPIDKGQAAQQESLGGITSAFSTAAGPRRSYEGIGGEGILEKAIRGTETEIPDFTNQAKALVGAQYTGPQALDQDTTEAISRALGNFQTQIGSPAGIRDLIRTQTPGLTPGMVRFEGGRLAQDPGFRERRDAERLELGRIFGKLGASTREAETYAQGRAAEEADIAAKATGYLTGERGEISADLQKKIDEQGASQEKAQAAWNKFYNSGNLAQLTQAGQATGQPDVGEGFATQNKLNEGLARDELRKITDRYADIKDVPLMQLAATSHGHQNMRFPDEWYAANAAKYTPAQMATMKERSRQRQVELEKTFGTQTPLQMFNPINYGGAKTVQELTAQGQGLIPDSRLYTSFDPGLKPSRGNVSSVQQREQFNRINDILDEADRIVESEPARAAKITSELDAYIADEEASMAKRTGSVRKGEGDWLNYLHKVRKKARKIRDQKKWREAIEAIPIANLIQYIGQNAPGFEMDKNFLASQASSGTSGHG